MLTTKLCFATRWCLKINKSFRADQHRTKCWDQCKNITVQFFTLTPVVAVGKLECRLKKWAVKSSIIAYLFRLQLLAKVILQSGHCFDWDLSCTRLICRLNWKKIHRWTSKTNVNGPIKITITWYWATTCAIFENVKSWLCHWKWIQKPTGPLVYYTIADGILTDNSEVYTKEQSGKGHFFDSTTRHWWDNQLL